MEIRHWSLNLSYKRDWLLAKYTTKPSNWLRVEVVMYDMCRKLRQNVSNSHPQVCKWKLSLRLCGKYFVCIVIIITALILHISVIILHVFLSQLIYKKPDFFSPPGSHLAYIFRDRIIKGNMWSIFSCSIISWHYTAQWCRLDSCNVPALDHVGLNIVHTACQQACEHEWAQLKGCFVSTLYWTLLHYWFAIWLPTINKLLRIWKLLSWVWQT